MSYEMVQLGQEFKIKAEHKDAAFKSLNKWAKKIEAEYRKKYGVCYSPVGGANNLEDALSCLGWDADLNATGDITELYFKGERLHDEDDWLEIIAPYVQRGSRLEMRGGDDYLWCWYFDGIHCNTYNGKIIYPDIPAD